MNDEKERPDDNKNVKDLLTGVNRKLKRYFSRNNRAKVEEYLEKLQTLRFPHELLKCTGLDETLRQIGSCEYGPTVRKFMVDFNLFSDEEKSPPSNSTDEQQKNPSPHQQSARLSVNDYLKKHGVEPRDSVKFPKNDEVKNSVFDPALRHDLEDVNGCIEDASQQAGFEESVRKKRKHSTEELKPLPSNPPSDFHDDEYFHCKRQRSVLYHGKRNTIRHIPTLEELATQCLRENVSKITHVGNVPFDLLRPVFECANPAELETIYELNPQLSEEFDCLWEKICRDKYKNAAPNDIESWYEVYLRKKSEEEDKFESFRLKVSNKYGSQNDGKSTKFTNLVSINHRQMSSDRNGGLFGRQGSASSSASSQQSNKQNGRAKMAPLMAKTIRMFKRQRR